MKKCNPKILSLLLAVTTVMSMSSPGGVFAAVNDDYSGDDYVNDAYSDLDIGVYGTYLDRLDSKKVLSVDVEWTNMNFEYAASKQGTWNPDTHTYDGGTDVGGWLNDNATITVRNHSNMGVTAELSYTKGTAENVSGSLSKELMELNTAEDTERDAPPSDETTFTVNGSMSEGETDLGTITVTVGDSESVFVGVDLSTLSVDDYEATIEAYLAKKDPDKTGGLTLKLKLPATTSTKMGNEICDALYDYYGGDSSKNCDVVLYGVQTITTKTFLFTGAGLKSLRFPDATKIEDQGFSDCFGNLETLIFDKVTSIGNEAFLVQYSSDGCFKLKNLIFKSVITNVGSKWIYDESGVTLTLNKDQDYTNDWPGYPTYFAGDSEIYPNGLFGNYSKWVTVQKG